MFSAIRPERLYKSELQMNKETFIAEDWLPSDIKAAPSTNPEPPERQDNDIELITERIESAHIDITSGYGNWRDIGFALADALGENGREIYHRISRFNESYTSEETNLQYDRCLRSNGTGITIRTFFRKAKEHGISLNTAECAECAKKTEYAHCASEHSTAYPQSADNVNIAHDDNSVNVDEHLQLPAFSSELEGKLPSFLEKVLSKSNSPEDADILLLGTLAVISACLPHIYGIYADRTVYPNLFLFVTAKASSGKGRLALCRYIVDPIHDRLREINEAETIEYKHKLAEYNAAGKKKVDMEKPEEPPMRMLFIPANSSATAVYQVLNDNGGQGLMFETEGDTLANTFGSDYGNYSDGFRKAFHHETISYIRRKDREYVNIRNPRLSTLLTGTPKQIMNLITDAENGLFSRFIFYFLDLRLVWNNVFSSDTDTTLDDWFRHLGMEFNDFYTLLENGHDIRFSFTSSQSADFNKRFEAWQFEYVNLCGDEFVASVRRLGLMTFRLAMILSALRVMEDGLLEERLTCRDIDYESSMTMASVILQHNAHIFSMLPKAETEKPGASSAAPRQTLQHRRFLESLPVEFDRASYTGIAQNIGINPRTSDRIIRRWCDAGVLENIAHGKYRKMADTATKSK